MKLWQAVKFAYSDDEYWDFTVLVALVFGGAAAAIFGGMIGGMTATFILAAGPGLLHLID